MHQKDHQLSCSMALKSHGDEAEYERENNFKYDFVVRLRTDFVAVANFGDLEKYDKDKLHVNTYTAALINQYRPGTWVEDLGIAERYIVDIFAMGGSDAMDKFAKVYDNIPLMMEFEYPMHSSDVLIGYNTFLLEKIPTKRHKSWVYKIYPQAEVYYEDQRRSCTTWWRYPGNYGIMDWKERLWNDY